MTQDTFEPERAPTRTWPRLLLVAMGLALTVSPGSAQAQEETGRVTVQAASDAGPVQGATVRAGRTGTLTDDRGEAVLTLPTGEWRIQVRKLGYASAAAAVSVRAGVDTTVVIALEERAVETEGFVVTSTRSERRIEDQPLRVEVLNREEIEEKLLMTPGDISMMLNETAGLRVQTTSPTLGGANVRVQGLRGRYTQLHADGLPLYGGQAGNLGLLQIPPMDLAQVEVIKGAASALYGASALGGVINLISRRPDGERELLLNRTSRGGTDGVLWSSGSLAGPWAYTFLGGGHDQRQTDVDGDGWSNVPGHRRVTARPRLFREGDDGGRLMLTLGGALEDRTGGTLPGSTAPNGEPFSRALRTERLDAGLTGRLPIGAGRILHLRASGMAQGHEHTFGEARERERDRHRTGFAEAAVHEVRGRAYWVAGAAVQAEGYRARDVPAHDYTFVTPSLFGQVEHETTPWLTTSLSGRADAHSEYGGFLSPRIALLLRPGGGWSLRTSAGTGYFAPTPFTDETEEVGLRGLVPLDGLAAERARTASVDLGWAGGPFELGATAFGSIIENAVAVRAVPDAIGPRPASIRLVNLDGPTRTYGTELLARFDREPFHLIATHTFIRAGEPSPGAAERREVALNPRHAVGVVGMWEEHGRSRAGVEVYYTGRQALHDNPYLSRSEPYTHVGVLVEHRIGPVRLFLNGENLLDVRQSRFHPLPRPAFSPDGGWTTDAWGPLEGRVFNGGVRVEF